MHSELDLILPDLPSGSVDQGYRLLPRHCLKDHQLYWPSRASEEKTRHLIGTNLVKAKTLLAFSCVAQGVAYLIQAAFILET